MLGFPHLQPSTGIPQSYNCSLQCFFWQKTGFNSSFWQKHPIANKEFGYQPPQKGHKIMLVTWWPTLWPSQLGRVHMVLSRGLPVLVFGFSWAEIWGTLCDLWRSFMWFGEKPLLNLLKLLKCWLSKLNFEGVTKCINSCWTKSQYRHLFYFSHSPAGDFGCLGLFIYLIRDGGTDSRQFGFFFTLLSHENSEA